MNSKSFLLALFTAVAVLPVAIYMLNFPDGISEKNSDWAAFGAYIGGVYGALAFVAVAISLHLTRVQFFIQHEEDLFYRSVEGLQARIMVTLVNLPVLVAP
jgi:hypothetical protein